MTKTNWYCELCGESFETKKELCEDLVIHFENATTDADIAQGQLDALGVKDYAKYL